MQFNYNWLQEWVKTDISAEKLAEQLTMAGLEASSVTQAAPEFSGIVVAQVLEVNPHPNADKLKICQVDVGQDSPISIVCGAPNVKTGMKAPAALIGAILPNNLRIKKTKLRGIESFGMLCSAKELGLSETASGLMELPKNAPIGTDVREYLQLNDQIITLELTPNRGDCASLRGISREIATLNNLPYNEIKTAPVEPVHKNIFIIKLSANNACPRYAGRIIKNINPIAETPIWMQERLRRCGIRSIAPVVDVTNYVLLELGQPMHAFDLEKLSKNIEVRFSKPKESLTLLNNETIELNPNTLVIADNEKPLAIAGIMGGLDSSVTESTKNIFLESAFFNPANIVGKARQYNLQTDSSYRFERGVDPQLQLTAIERATKLLLDIVGGEPGPIIDETSKEFLPKLEKFDFHPSKTQKLLGIQIPNEETLNILNKLGISIDKSNTDVWHAEIPSWRFDLHFEADLIEEIARIYGYDKIPAKTHKAEFHMPKISANTISLRRIRYAMQDLDYNEVISYSFIDPIQQKLLDSDQQPIALVNPISSDMSVMRTNLWPGLLNIFLYNSHRQQNRIRLFETGLRFLKINETIKQQTVISGLVCGSVNPEQWGEKQRAADFFDVKTDIETLLKLAGPNQNCEFQSGHHPALHSGQCAKIIKNNQILGFLGALNPAVTQQLNLNLQAQEQQIFLFELELEALQQSSLPKYTTVSKYPSIRRDIAIIVDKQISAQDIQTKIREKAGNLLTDLFVFDVYQGKNIDKNKKSIALGLILQHPSRTLSDEKVCDILKNIIISLEYDFKAKLRD